MRLTVGDKTITSIKAYKTQILAKQAAAKKLPVTRENGRIGMGLSPNTIILFQKFCLNFFF